MVPPASPPTALVTGASSGIGRATAHLLAERGYRLVLVARGRAALDDAAEECRASGAADVEVCPADVTDDEAFGAVVRAAVQRFGRLDAVVHAAQVLAYGRVEELPREVFEAVVDTALHGTATVARHVLPVFRRQETGHLVVVSSVLAQTAAPLMGSYVAAKWGQLGLVRVLQQETRDAPGVTVSAVTPGGVSTPIYDQAASWTGSTGRPPPPVYSPQRVADRVLSTLERPRRQVHSGFINGVVVAVFRLFPVVYDRLVAPVLERVALGGHDAPPTEGNVFRSRPEGNATRGRWHGI